MVAVLLAAVSHEPSRLVFSLVLSYSPHSTSLPSPLPASFPSSLPLFLRPFHSGSTGLEPGPSSMLGKHSTTRLSALYWHLGVY